MVGKFPVGQLVNRQAVHWLNQVLVQAGLFAGCYGLAFLLRHRYFLSPEALRGMALTMPIVVLIKLVIFHRIGVSQQTDPNVLPKWAPRKVLQLTGLAGGLVWLVQLAVGAFASLPISPLVIVIDGGLSMAALGLPHWFRYLSTASEQTVSKTTSPQPTRFQRIGGRVLVGVALMVGVAFPIRLGFLLASVGENTLGYDYVFYAEKFDAILSADYDWKNLPLDSMITGGSHCMMVPFLVRVPIILFTEWNQHVEIALGVALAAIKVLLLVALLGRGTKGAGKAVLFALISGLIFSLAHFESFQFGTAAMNQHMADVWFLGGCWFLVSRPRMWSVGMALCGVMASLSYGSGILSWPTYFIGLIVLKEMRWRSGLAWLAGCCLSAVPYILYRSLGAADQRVAEKNWFPVKTWIESLTLPFFTYWDVLDKKWTWMLAGSLGMVFGFLMVSFALKRFWKDQRADLVPAGLILLYSLGTMWLISFGRKNLAPWYGVHFTLIWSAIVGYAFLLGRRTTQAPTSSWILRRPVGLGWFPITVGGIVGLFLIPANLSLAGKEMFLPSRSPVAVSALREFRTAPTHYAQFPYPMWRPNHLFHTRHAQQLEKRGWSVFGKQRLYLLQGDFGLDCVELHEAPQAPPIRWIHRRDPQPCSFTDYRRLNLWLPASNAVTWEIKIPSETASAVFRSAVGTTESAETLPLCEVQLAVEGDSLGVVWTNEDYSGDSTWQPCEISLKEYAGNTIRLTLRCLGNSPQAAVWREPQIQMELSRLPEAPEIIAPSNTDAQKFPTRSAHDHVLNLAPKCWPAPQQTRPLGWTVTTGTTPLEYAPPLDLSCREYSHFYWECSLSEPHQLYHNVAVVIQGEAAGETFQKEVVVPLLFTDEARAYCLDLRKLEILPESRIQKLRLKPASAERPGGSRLFQLHQARFVKREIPSAN